MAILNLNDATLVKAPPYYFNIGSQQYAIALVDTPSVSAVYMLLLKAVPGGHQTIYAQVPEVSEARVKNDGGVAEFVQIHLDKFNVELKKRHPEGGSKVDDIFNQIARFLQENIVISDKELVAK